MFIPMSMKVDNEAEIPEGNVEKVCRICNSRFSVPSQDADNYQTCVCEDCQPTYDKQIAVASASLMKDPAGAAETIQNALGK